MSGSEEKQIEFLKIVTDSATYAIVVKLNEIIKTVNKLIAKDNLSLEAINRLGTAHSVAEDMKHGCFMEFYSKGSEK